MSQSVLGYSSVEGFVSLQHFHKYLSQIINLIII